MDPAELERAFKQALQDSGALSYLESIDTSLKAYAPPGAEPTTPPAPSATDPDALSGDVEPTAPVNLNTESAEEGLGSLKDIVNGVRDALKQVRDQMADFDEFMRKDLGLEAGLDFYEQIQASYGGIQGGLQDITNETTMHMKESIEGMQDLFHVTGDGLRALPGSLKVLDIQTGKTVNLMQRLYKTPAEMFRANETLANEFFDQHQARYNEMSVEQQAHMHAYAKGFDIDISKIAKVVKTQISLTGKAGTDMLNEISAYSKKVAEVTGVSYKQISQGVVELVTDIKTFGDIQVEEAARIAGALQQLGMSYQSFGSMVDKYMTFENAAAAISDLTSVFGVHMDAMEMMRLANEDEEEFMHRMRDSFIEQGIAVDDLSKAQRNMLATTLGIDAAEVENFFDPDLMEAGLEDMEAATEEADLSKGLQEAATSAERFARTIEDAEAIVNDRMFAGGRQALYEMGRAYEGSKMDMMGDALNIAAEAGKGLTSTLGGVAASMEMAFGNSDELVAKWSASSSAVLQQQAADVAAGLKKPWEAFMTGVTTDLPAVLAVAGEEGDKFVQRLSSSTTNWTTAIGSSAKDTTAAIFQDLPPEMRNYGYESGENWSAGLEAGIVAGEPSVRSIELEANVQASSTTERQLDNLRDAQQEARSAQREESQLLNHNIGLFNRTVQDAINTERDRPRVINLVVDAKADGRSIFQVLRSFRDQNGEVIVVDNVEETGE